MHRASLYPRSTSPASLPVAHALSRPPSNPPSLLSNSHDSMDTETYPSSIAR